MNLKDAFDAISTQECLGYSPVSSSTKPAHIANGWFRRLIGKAYDPVLLNNTIIHWVGSKEENPSEALLHNNADVFAPFLPQNKRQQFVDFRADLRALLSPYGGAANRGNNWSSYNITHREHLTRDRADNSVGAFLYHLLMTDCGAGASPFGELITSILNDPSDELSTVTLPLTRQAGESVINVPSYPAPNVFRRTKSGFTSPVLRQTRRGFDQLSAYESNGGGGLEALRRAVAFGVFAVLLHMVNRARELRKEKGLTPMLLYFQGRRRNTVYYGSHQTYTICRQAIEFMYIEKFRERIVDRIGETPTLKQCQKLVKELEFGRPSDAPGKREEILNLLMAYSNTQRPVRDYRFYPLRHCIVSAATAPADIFIVDVKLGGFVDYSEGDQSRDGQWDSHIKALQDRPWPKGFRAGDSGEGLYLFSGTDLPSIDQRRDFEVPWRSVVERLNASELKDCITYRVLGFYRHSWLRQETLITPQVSGPDALYRFRSSETVLLKLLFYGEANRSGEPKSLRLEFDSKAFTSASIANLIVNSHYNEERILLPCARTTEPLITTLAIVQNQPDAGIWSPQPTFVLRVAPFGPYLFGVLVMLGVSFFLASLGKFSELWRDINWSDPGSIADHMAKVLAALLFFVATWLYLRKFPLK